MTLPSFVDLVGDVDSFFSQHFDKVPLVRRGALMGSHHELFSLADVDELLHNEAVRPPHVRVFRDGNAIFEGAYTQEVKVQGAYMPNVVDPHQVVRRFRAGNTVTLNSVNHFHRKVRRLCAGLAEVFATEVEAMAFLTPQGVQSFQAHHDPVDNYVIQLNGTKRWQVWPTPPVRAGRPGYFTAGDLGEPLLDVSLAPGDVLYLPYNTPHLVRSEDAVSLHLAVLVRPRRWTDLLGDVVREITGNDSAFWGFPRLGAGDAEQELREAISALVSRLERADLKAMVGRLVAASGKAVGTRMETPISDHAMADAITPADVLVVRPDGAVSDRKRLTDNGIEFVVDGLARELPAAAEAVVKRLLDGDEIRVGAELGEDTAALDLARKLVQIGVARIVRDR